MSRRPWLCVWVLVGAPCSTGGLKVAPATGLGSAELGGNSSTEASDGSEPGDWRGARLSGAGADIARLNMCVRGTPERPVLTPFSLSCGMDGMYPTLLYERAHPVWKQEWIVPGPLKLAGPLGKPE